MKDFFLYYRKPFPIFGIIGLLAVYFVYTYQVNLNPIFQTIQILVTVSIPMFFYHRDQQQKQDKLQDISDMLAVYFEANKRGATELSDKKSNLKSFLKDIKPLLSDTLISPFMDYKKRQTFEHLQEVIDRDNNPKDPFKITGDTLDKLDLLLKSLHKEIIELDNGKIFLIKASAYGDFDAVEELISNRINVNYQDKMGITALMSASVSGHLDIVEALIKAKANVNLKNKVMGRTALMSASIEDHLDIVTALIEAKANVNLKNKFGQTALMSASYKDHLDVVKTLIKAKANVNLKDKSNQTALIFASHKGHLEIVRALINAGANINHQDKDQKTALIRATIQGHLEIVKALISARADVNIQDQEDKTALSYAQYFDHQEIINTLKEAGAK